MTRERVYLRVPFAEKQAAKRLGARRDQAVKRCIVPGDHDLAAFARWWPQSEYGPYKWPGVTTLSNTKIAEDVNSLVDRVSQERPVRSNGRTR